MVFIKDLTKISDTKYTIGFIHYMPMDKTNGLQKSQDELLKEGKLVELPARLTDVAGKDQTLYYNPVDNVCFWEYVDVPQAQEQSLQEQISSLGQTVAQEKLKNMQKDSTIEQLGQELAKVKLDLIKLQGGTV